MANNQSTVLCSFGEEATQHHLRHMAKKKMRKALAKEKKRRRESV
jgi:hypothetical protein